MVPGVLISRRCIPACARSGKHGAASAEEATIAAVGKGARRHGPAEDLFLRSSTGEQDMCTKVLYHLPGTWYMDIRMAERVSVPSQTSAGGASPMACH